jgi:hypothetical protein
MILGREVKDLMVGEREPPGSGARFREEAPRIMFLARPGEFHPGNETGIANDRWKIRARVLDSEKFRYSDPAAFQKGHFRTMEFNGKSISTGGLRFSARVLGRPARRESEFHSV